MWCKSAGSVCKDVSQGNTRHRHGFTHPFAAIQKRVGAYAGG